MFADRDVADLLREHGLRVTPQRRAILGAFTGAGDEHLAADEIHARAAQVVPELGRGTVYATLAELTDVGILAAHGSPEPVRYERNTDPHEHFRCRICLRLFDVDLDVDDDPGSALRAQGFDVERLAVTATGVCAECVAYDRGLRAGARRARARPSDDLPADVAAAAVDTPLGPLTLAATAHGLVRAVFDNHGDVPRLREAISRGRGARAAHAQLEPAKAAIARYFAAGVPDRCEIDWDAIADAPTLQAVMAVPPAAELSYDALATDAPAERIGRAIGANPLAIVVPCHRVTRGVETSADYVGGLERRLALCDLEARVRGPSSG